MAFWGGGGKEFSSKTKKERTRNNKTKTNSKK